ncbi:MAG: DUF3800 domain-containing protein [Candidatus Dadabacteria bacterium]|nr:DUF3800 domain-containing protein [Candidatus Dadabacteria bacterium]
MYVCYIDEAGCVGSLPSNVTNVQPVFVLCGLIVPETSITALTHEFLSLKRRFNPHLASTLEHALDIVKYEIKGAEDIRRPIRSVNRNQRRRAIGFLDNLLTLLERWNCRILPYIYIKSPVKPVKGVELYARYMQNISKGFQEFLKSHDDKGIMIADSRNHTLNVRTSHSIFTQKFKAGGDAYPNVVEMPVYGHSDNHAAIQITDILCSAILFPVAAYAYCTGHITSIHVNDNYKVLQSRYSGRIGRLSFRYSDGIRYLGGVTVSDELEGRNPNHFFGW